jgi:hypothetical protein
MYKSKLSPEQALETIKLRMKYDSSKTLTENVSIVDEQGLAGNPMTGQASGGQTYGGTSNTSGTKWYDVIEKWANRNSKKFKARDDQFWYYSNNKDVWNFKKNGTFIYAYADGQDSKGNWVVNGADFKITTEDGDKFDSKSNKWSGAPSTSNSNNSSTGAASTGAASTSQTTNPTGLTDVKAFQYWLDKNKPGWATGYTGGILGKGKGYGTYGPRTKKAWEDVTIRNEFLKDSSITPTPTPTPAKSEEEEAEAVYGDNPSDIIASN